MKQIFEGVIVALIAGSVFILAVFIDSDRKSIQYSSADVVRIQDRERTGDRDSERKVEIITIREYDEDNGDRARERAYEENEDIVSEPTTVAEEQIAAPESIVEVRETCKSLLDSSPFYMNPEMTVIRLEREYRINGEIEIADALQEIACHPQATWLTWKDAESMKQRVERVTRGAEEAGQIPVLVIYNSPDYNSPKWWVGNEGKDYLDWVEAVAEGIGDRQAWIIIEPDALGLATDYNEEDKLYRLNELSAVVSIIKQIAPNAKVYLDAGHNKWKTPEIFAELLRGAGIDKADGFVQNISNYQATIDEVARALELSKLVGNKPFIIDTSRNGVGAPIDNEWCNARGRALGTYPTIDTGNPLIDAFYWVKPPGESDGTCNDGPTPGKFWLEYALELVENAK